MSIQVIGTVSTVQWYEFEDGVYSIHRAMSNGTETLFASRSDTWPSITASREGIEYDLCVNATSEEAEKFIAAEGLTLKAVHEV